MWSQSVFTRRLFTVANLHI